MMLKYHVRLGKESWGLRRLSPPKEGGLLQLSLRRMSPTKSKEDVSI
jgi:hypothetical protein